MDESFQEFEGELKALSPRRIDPPLLGRIAKELAVPVGRPLVMEKNKGVHRNTFVDWRWLVVGAAGLAATLTIFLTVSRRFGPVEAVAGSESRTVVRASPDASTGAKGQGPGTDNAYKPVAAANVLYEMKDEGPVPAKGNNAERRVRYRYVDTYTW